MKVSKLGAMFDRGTTPDVMIYAYKIYKLANCSDITIIFPYLSSISREALNILLIKLKVSELGAMFARVTRHMGASIRGTDTTVFKILRQEVLAISHAAKKLLIKSITL